VNENTLNVDRRTLLAGAAWSVPVVALAVATPFAAASTVNNLYVQWGGFEDAAVVGTAADSTPITLRRPTEVDMFNGSSTEAVPAGQSVTMTLVQTAGASLAAGSVVFRSVSGSVTNVAGIGTSTVTFDTDAEIPAPSGSLVALVEIGLSDAPVQGVGEATTWSFTCTVPSTTVGESVDNTLSAWTGASTVATP
jgi:hypothetical protein